jgi:hypothetical protein
MTDIRRDLRLVFFIKKQSSFLSNVYYSKNENKMVKKTSQLLLRHFESSYFNKYYLVFSSLQRISKDKVKISFTICSTT